MFGVFKYVCRLALFFMNIIHQLFDEDYVVNFFRKKVLPLYSPFKDVKKVVIRAHKNHIWENTYHVVIEFKVFFITNEGGTKTLPIFCSAHSDEPRENVYKAMKCLWENNFSTGTLTAPHPLFYSAKFKAIFYRGVQGHNLYHYIRNVEKEEIEKIVAKTAKWFCKLHNVRTAKKMNFNEQNSLIRKVVPGQEHVFKSIGWRYPEYKNFYKKAYSIFIKKEEKFLRSSSNKWLIHGDAHPENIIKINKHKIAVIDYTDMCLSDFARDLGGFMQQVEFMINRKIEDRSYGIKIKVFFLEEYLKNAKLKLDEDLKERIDNYYNWTMIRTATFFLIKHNPEPDRGRALLEQLKKNLNL